MFYLGTNKYNFKLLLIKSLPSISRNIAYYENETRALYVPFNALLGYIRTTSEGIKRRMIVLSDTCIC